MFSPLCHQETLIVWSEAPDYDLALSFQEKAGCDEIWDKICEVQGRDPSVEVTQESTYDSDSENGENAEGVLNSSSPGLIQLPLCELSRLNDILESISSSMANPMRREQVAIAIEKDKYIPKLLEVFRQCEDLENVESLHLLYLIFHKIFMLNKNALFEILFNESNIKDVIGVLEYSNEPSSGMSTGCGSLNGTNGPSSSSSNLSWDAAESSDKKPLPSNSPTCDSTTSLPSAQSQKKSHREYLWNEARFKEVLPIANSDLKAKIHQTYRIQYIQDVIFPSPSVFEENLLSTLNSFIFFNKVEIVSLMQEDETFISELFSQLRSEDTSIEQRRNLMLFLKEFCIYSQNMQLQSRQCFIKKSEDYQTKLAVTDVLATIAESNATTAREYAIRQAAQTQPQVPDNQLLINLIIEQVLSDPDPDDYRTAHLNSLLIELISFCIEHHTYLSRHYVLNHNLIKRVLVQLKSKHAFLALSAIRLVRKIVGLKDEFYNRHIIKMRHLGPLVDCLVENRIKYNLINSALLEFFDYLRMEDVKSLCSHLVEQFVHRLDCIDYVKTFEILKTRFPNQLAENADKHDGPFFKPSVSPGPSSSPLSTMNKIPALSAQRFRRDPRDLDEEEENYFNEEDEEWEEDSPSSTISVSNRNSAATPPPLSPTSSSESPERSGLSLTPTLTRTNSGDAVSPLSSPEVEDVELSNANPPKRARSSSPTSPTLTRTISIRYSEHPGLDVNFSGGRLSANKDGLIRKGNKENVSNKINNNNSSSSSTSIGIRISPISSLPSHSEASSSSSIPSTNGPSPSKNPVIANRLGGRLVDYEVEDSDEEEESNGVSSSAEACSPSVVVTHRNITESPSSTHEGASPVTSCGDEDGDHCRSQEDEESLRNCAVSSNNETDVTSTSQDDEEEESERQIVESATTSSSPSPLAKKPKLDESLQDGVTVTTFQKN